MKHMKSLLAVLAMLGLGAAGPAWADHRHYDGGHRGGSHSRVGIYLGVPLWSWHYPRPRYYYYPDVVTVTRPAPTVYVERESAPPAPPAPSAGPSTDSAYWYYCAKSETYYPYVQQCPGGWLKVVPEPPAGR